jgi:hypothetical protein
MVRALLKNVCNGHLQALVKELEENKYIVKYIEKPIQVADLIEIVASTIS